MIALYIYDKTKNEIVPDLVRIEKIPFCKETPVICRSQIQVLVFRSLFASVRAYCMDTVAPDTKWTSSSRIEFGTNTNARTMLFVHTTCCSHWLYLCPAQQSIRIHANASMFFRRFSGLFHFFFPNFLSFFFSLRFYSQTKIAKVCVLNIWLLAKPIQLRWVI